MPPLQHLELGQRAPDVVGLQGDPLAVVLQHPPGPGQRHAVSPPLEQRQPQFSF
jgi:hypothetical protein